MSNPLSRAAADGSIPAAAAAASVSAAGPVVATGTVAAAGTVAATGLSPGRATRKGPRRATAPAGAPATTATPALLVIGSDGMMVPIPASTPSGTVGPGTDRPGTVGPGTDRLGSVGPGTATAMQSPSHGSPVDLSVQDSTADEAVNGQSSPASRRARRQAEQKVGSTHARFESEAVVLETLRDREAPAPNAKTPDTAVRKTTARDITVAPTTGSTKRGRFAAWVKASFVLLVISVLVIGMGTVLSGAEDARGPSDTEVNRQSSWETTKALADQATALAATSTVPQVQELLHQVAADLAVQSTALSDGLSPSTSPSTTASVTSNSVPVTEFIRSLSTSGDELLQHALIADRAMGGVFAAVGTSQLVQGQNLSSAVGSTSALTPFLPPRVDFAAPQGPVCTSTLEPRPGATLDEALRAAAVGEQKAVYAYQVAATRLTEPRFSTATALLARHETKLEVLNAELRVRCLPPASPVAGFALDAAFTAAPAQALSGLETELASIFADLAALSSVPLDGTPGVGTPGAGASAGPTPSNVTGLREISVTWLLDSALAQDEWGGGVDALSGMPSD